MSDSAAKLQDIFDLEIERIHGLAKDAPLDIADLKRLETLVKSYSAFKKQDLKDGDTLDDVPTEELLKSLKP